MSFLSIEDPDQDAYSSSGSDQQTQTFELARGFRDEIFERDLGRLMLYADAMQQQGAAKPELAQLQKLTGGTHEISFNIPRAA